MGKEQPPKESTATQSLVDLFTDYQKPLHRNCGHCQEPIRSELRKAIDAYLRGELKTFVLQAAWMWFCENIPGYDLSYSALRWHMNAHEKERTVQIRAKRRRVGADE